MSDESETPDPHTACLDVLRQHVSGGGEWPADLPADFDGAARFWLHTIEPPHPRWDRPKTVESRSEHTSRTVYPYIDRAVYTLRIFLCLDPNFQRLIIRASEDGIHWRGDTEPMFRMILHEHARMEEIGLDSYRAETRQKARRVYVGMRSGA